MRYKKAKGEASASEKYFSCFRSQHSGLEIKLTLDSSSVWFLSAGNSESDAYKNI